MEPVLVYENKEEINKILIGINAKVQALNILLDEARNIEGLPMPTTLEEMWQLSKHPEEYFRNKVLEAMPEPELINGFRQRKNIDNIILPNLDVIKRKNIDVERTAANPYFIGYKEGKAIADPDKLEEMYQGNRKYAITPEQLEMNEAFKNLVQSIKTIRKNRLISRTTNLSYFVNMDDVGNVSENQDFWLHLH